MSLARNTFEWNYPKEEEEDKQVASCESQGSQLWAIIWLVGD